ncbi:hypothetical protein PT974_06480 [Cladobotryum mycophilum]|uniref:Uncharacterized protein n=1 Tax=Cladobotryum mycophilum TaxID=491253 RepID=A0ABR0SLQ1_9HYPO
MDTTIIAEPITSPMDTFFVPEVQDRQWELPLQDFFSWNFEVWETEIQFIDQAPTLNTEDLVPDTTSHANHAHLGVIEPSSIPVSTISDHELAQHYIRNLTSLYSSKNPGWNFHTYFFNRFSSKYPFVMAALYAWTAAHLFCQEYLASPANSMTHYQKTTLELKERFSIDVVNRLDIGVSSFATNQDDLDAIAVSLYFLASTDLILSRPERLRNLLEVEAGILRARPLNGPDSVFTKIATWFCFLDARMSTFGRDHDRVIQTVGGEMGMLAALHESEHFLQNEYKRLYPLEERRRDAAHLPLYKATCRLVVLWGCISRFYGNNGDVTLKSTVRNSLDDIQHFLNKASEAKAAEDDVLSIFFTTSTLYHALEIYYSRAVDPEAPLYTADHHATSIIRTTDRYYQALSRPRKEPPPTKVWPLPLVMAAIEANDSIYRGWAVQRIREYEHAGKHYANSSRFVETVFFQEQGSRRRTDLAAAAESMGDDFVI